MLLQVVGCHEETPYVQLVAIDKDGNEVASTCTCDDSFGGYYALRGDNKWYEINVVRRKVKKRKKPTRRASCRKS